MLQIKTAIRDPCGTYTGMGNTVNLVLPNISLNSFGAFCRNSEETIFKMLRYCDTVFNRFHPDFNFKM